MDALRDQMKEMSEKARGSQPHDKTAIVFSRAKKHKQPGPLSRLTWSAYEFRTLKKESANTFGCGKHWKGGHTCSDLTKSDSIKSHMSSITAWAYHKLSSKTAWYDTAWHVGVLQAWNCRSGCDPQKAKGLTMAFSNLNVQQRRSGTFFSSCMTSRSHATHSQVQIVLEPWLSQMPRSMLLNGKCSNHLVLSVWSQAYPYCVSLRLLSWKPNLCNVAMICQGLAIYLKIQVSGIFMSYICHRPLPSNLMHLWLLPWSHYHCQSLDTVWIKLNHASCLLPSSDSEWYHSKPNASICRGWVECYVGIRAVPGLRWANRFSFPRETKWYPILLSFASIKKHAFSWSHCHCLGVECIIQHCYGSAWSNNKTCQSAKLWSVWNKVQDKMHIHGKNVERSQEVMKTHQKHCESAPNRLLQKQQHLGKHMWRYSRTGLMDQNRSGAQDSNGSGLA